MNTQGNKSMPSNDDQGQFLMFTGIGAVGMSAILAVVYFVGFAGDGDAGGNAPAADAVADSGSATPSAPGNAMPDSPNGAASPPGMQNPIMAARAAAKATQYKNNMKQVLLCAHNYHDTHRSFPVAKDALAKNPGLSWRVHLLPFMDQGALYNQFAMDEPWDSPTNKALLGRMPKAYETLGAPANHTGIVRYDHEKAFPNSRPVGMREIRDGTSNSIFCVVVDGSAAVPWTKPADHPFDPNNPKAGLLDMNGRFLIGLCDGSVRMVNTSIDPKTLNNLIMIGDGEVPGSF
jgi:hypothetical protein